MQQLFRVLLLGASITALMYGKQKDAPEISGDSAASAIALVSGTLLICRTRLKR
jgi:hypothetical protein